MNLLTKPALALHVALTCSLLGACATTAEPRVKVQTVAVPVMRPCVPAEIPAAPSSYPDDVLPKAADAGPDRYRLTAAANDARKARLALLEPVVAACR